MASLWLFFLPDRMLPKENGKLQSTHIELHCKILNVNFRWGLDVRIWCKLPLALLLSGPLSAARPSLWVGGQPVYRQFPLTLQNDTHRQQQKPSAVTVRWLLVKRRTCIATAKVMTNIKQWQDTLTVLFYFSTFKSGRWVIWIRFICHTGSNLNSWSEWSLQTYGSHSRFHKTLWHFLAFGLFIRLFITCTLSVHNEYSPLTSDD